ncbi:hypothetical protein PIB30_022397 [Stylosanthes scabra]|uniref:Inactive poly [ADP-ribose] polymerase RCD1-like n=1 Tax=Stylosanthes scabra TaxID=79078 RepID=A0ABU6Y7R7_9FABA|nr:hypothetical protein [Stylosanthes scabra]
MEGKTAKALDRVALHMKRKRATRYDAHLNRASLPLHQWSSSTSKVAKRMRSGQCKSKMTNGGTHMGQLLRVYYLNYKKTGRPERVMFYKNGDWLDFPKDVVDLVKKDLEVKKATVEVQSNGHHLVLDFLHMYQMDLKTGLQQPLAWIDEHGCCFFPEILKQEGVSSNVPDEIKLHLEIAIKESDDSKTMEHSGESNAGESNALVKSIRIDAIEQNDVEFEDSINNMDCRNVGEAIEQKEDLGLGDYTDSVYGKLDLDTVQTMFLKGMVSSGIDNDIVEIYRCSSATRQARLELFQMQAEITKKTRGDANIQYAWLALSKNELSTMMQYGLGHCGLSLSKCKYAVGVHLAAASCPYASARYCDVDENGNSHLVLCRVIMGNMELLPPGGRQFRASSGEYDNGVDDILHPTYYIIWNMNMNSHIYPEFIVSFKVATNIQGNRGNPGVNVFAAGQHDHSQPESSTIDNGKAVHAASLVPKSPWMPFPALFAAIKSSVPPSTMDVIEGDYEQFKKKQISRDAFIQRLRLIAGDNLLRTTVHKLQYQIPRSGESKAPAKEEP